MNYVGRLAVADMGRLGCCNLPKTSQARQLHSGARAFNCDTRPAANDVYAITKTFLSNGTAGVTAGGYALASYVFFHQDGTKAVRLALPTPVTIVCCSSEKSEEATASCVILHAL